MVLPPTIASAEARAVATAFWTSTATAWFTAEIWPAAAVHKVKQLIQCFQETGVSIIYCLRAEQILMSIKHYLKAAC